VAQSGASEFVTVSIVTGNALLIASAQARPATIAQEAEPKIAWALPN
jgi:hypothetical protein